MAEIYANNAKGRLAAPITDSDTSIALVAGHTFPEPGANWYRATLYRWEHSPEGIREFDHEVVRVIGLAGDTLTVERALEGGPFAYDPETQIELRMTAGTADSIEARAQDAADSAEASAKAYTDAHEARTDNIHGVTKAQVGLGSVDNVSAASLRDRSTHTGTQPLSTISDAGTAASLDVTADNADTTPGRLLRVRDFGLGVPYTAVGSWAIEATAANGRALNRGFYRIPPNDADSPFAGTSAWGITATAGINDTAARLAGSWSNTSPALAYQIYQNGEWQEAHRVHHSGLTAADFAGMPRVNGDPIVQSGSNSDGQWTRWADGTQVCTVSEYPITGFGSFGSGTLTNPYRSSDPFLNYPNIFISTPSVVASADSRVAGADRLVWAIAQPARTQVRVQAHSYVTSSVEPLLSIMAIGRWK